MPYILKKVKDGYKVCKKADKTKCFSKEDLPKETAVKQMKAIQISEHTDLEGGLKPISARIGGKVLLKKKIVNEYFPASSSYKTYVEPFVGGGSVYFYKNKDMHKEVVNDLDPHIYDLFKGLQKYAGKKLEEDVNGDYTKEDFDTIKASHPTSDYARFLKTYLLYKLSYFGRGSSFGKPRINTKFDPYKERLEDVTILKEDYTKVIKEYDGPDTFFFLDPPVTGQVGNFNFQPIDIKELAEVCKNIKGKFLLALADAKVKKELFKGFTIKSIPTKYVGSKTKGGQSVKVNELLIMNYNPKNTVGSGEGGMDKFHKQLEKDKITHEQYMEAVKKAAEKNDYNPSMLEMASDGNHKLTYKTPDGKVVPFGKVDYNDYIIYTLSNNKFADKYKNAYRARATKIKGDWEDDKYSPNNLAINILW